jgi:hypothetical protein
MGVADLRLVKTAILGVVVGCLLGVVGTGSEGADGKEGRSVAFADRVWAVKVGRARGPGPNNWSAEKEIVRVDAKGNLHLAISPDKGSWNCAEVTAPKSLGYGEYRWVIAGDFSALSLRSILGIFLYEDDDHEIDFELSRWGEADAPNAQFVFQPSSKDSRHRFDLGKAKVITISMDWSEKGVSFRCWGGEDTTKKPLNEWTYKGAKNPKAGRERVHMNFWLFKGKASPGAKREEVVIESFAFTPRAR